MNTHTESDPRESDPRAAQKVQGKRKVLLVDDHPVTCQGVAALINREADVYVCGQAHSASAALDLVRRLNPEIAVVDISLKGTSGIEFLKQARAIQPSLRVLMMSMYDEKLYAARAFRAGAMGYIMKHEASEKIVGAIRNVIAGRPYVSESLKENLVLHVLGSKSDEVEDSMESLSDREMEVFELIGTGLTTRQIAERLHLSVKTIDSYREHLKIKLRLNHAPELLQHAIMWNKTKHLA